MFSVLLRRYSKVTCSTLITAHKNNIEKCFKRDEPENISVDSLPKYFIVSQEKSRIYSFKFPILKLNIRRLKYHSTVFIISLVNGRRTCN